MVAGNPKRDMLKIRVKRYTGDTKVKAVVDVCVVGTAVRSIKIGSGAIGKRMNWVFDSRQAISK